MNKTEEIFKVNLNNLDFRYDVFQMINIFYPFSTIQFVEDDFNLKVEVYEGKILVKDNKKEEEFTIDMEHKVKEEVRKAVFNFLTKETGKKLPWGTLVGIRPSKKALELLEKGYSEKEIIEVFKRKHETSEDKAKLCIEVAKYEKNIVNNEENKISIYLGMPFCPTRCLYCSFTSNPIGGCKSLVKPYLESLSKEIKALSKYISEHSLIIESVYFGGGTPTAIDDDQFHQVMKDIYEHFIRNKNIKEFTVECGRPDSITQSKLKSMKEYKVQRISINPQTMNDNTLKLIGRNHSAKDAVDKFLMARELGFDNINMDMIVGLPGEGLKEIDRTCNELLKLNPDSITIHGMSIKRASKLYENIINNKTYEIPEQQELNQMYEATSALAEKLQMIPYYMYRQKNMVGNMENLGYSKKGKEGIYNIQMIEERQTIIALGADAVSKIIFLEENRIERFGNVKDVKEYINRIDEMIKKKVELLDTLYKSYKIK